MPSKKCKKTEGTQENLKLNNNKKAIEDIVDFYNIAN